MTKLEKEFISQVHDSKHNMTSLFPSSDFIIFTMELKHILFFVFNPAPCLWPAFSREPKKQKYILVK